MLNSQFCKIFDIPFFQFAQMKKYCPEDILIIKATYKENWECHLPSLILSVGAMVGKSELISLPIINMSSTKIQR